MRKIINTLTLAAIILLMILSASSCSKNEFKVYFIVDGENYQTVGAASDKKVSMPSDPKKDEHIFDGWFIDFGKWEMPFDENFFIGKKYSSDLYVYAKWSFLHEHVPGEWITTTQATCQSDGTRIKKCTVCDTTVETEKTDRLPHTEITVPGYAPTDERDGLTDGSYCAVCSEIIAVQELIPATLQGTAISSYFFTVYGTTLKASVSNSTETIDLRASLKINYKASISFYLDAAQTMRLEENEATLSDGENIFYALVKKGEDQALYTLIIKRSGTVTVSFNTNGGTDLDSITADEGAHITPPTPERIGYTFIGWDVDFASPVTSDITANAVWEARNDTPYSIYYYIENESGEYTIHSEKSCVGTTDTEVFAEIITIYGYVYKSEASTISANIAADGSLVLKVYYDRAVFTVKFDTKCDAKIDDVSVKFGSLLPVPKEITNGVSQFLGWRLDGKNWDFDNDTVTSDMTLAAGWACITDHEIGELITEREATCKEDGLRTQKCSVCGKVLYSEAIPKLPHTEDLLVGTPATDITDGYTDGAYCTVCNTVTKEQQLIPARLQGTDIDSDLFEITGSELSISLPSSTSTLSISENLKFNSKSTVLLFTDEELKNEVQGGTVNLSFGTNTFYAVICSGEDSKIYTIKIHRKEICTVTFNFNNGTEPSTVIVDVGKLVTPPVATRVGYTFSGWDFDFSNPITQNITANAIWIPKADTPYRVEHYLELENGDFLLCHTENLSGITGNVVSARPLTISGYTLINDISLKSSAILGDGTLVLKMYYGKSALTVSFDTKCNATLPSANVMPGEYVPEPDSITNDGAIFMGWYYNGELWNFETDTVRENMTLTARWKYKVVFLTDDSERAVYVEDGEKLEMPEPPKTDSMTFHGWYIFGSETRWNFDNPVNSNLILKAKILPTLPEDEFF